MTRRRSTARRCGHWPAHLASAPVSSRALLAFRDYLARYVASAGFTALAGETKDRKDALGRIRYCTRIKGDRVEVTRYAGEADYSAMVLETFERFKQGAVKDYLIRYRMRPGMNHVAAQILDLVARLFPEEFADLDEYCSRHAAFLDDGIRRAYRELQFYLAYLDYIGPLRAAGLSFCYPEVSASSKDVRADGTFDLALARKLVAQGTPVVTNDFRLEGRERIAVVTGPNQGGKTTFARTFGQLHHLAGVGCPVPGSAARLFLFDRLFTHFEREEDLAARTGKLEDDLIRIGGDLAGGHLGQHRDPQRDLRVHHHPRCALSGDEAADQGHAAGRAVRVRHVRGRTGLARGAGRLDDEHDRPGEPGRAHLQGRQEAGGRPGLRAGHRRETQPHL